MLEILIVNVRGSWRLLTAAGPKGRFDYRVDAEEAALKLARRYGTARIQVQDRFGELKPLAA